MQCEAGSKLGELVLPRHCHYCRQSWARKRLKRILSILNTLLYFLQLVFIFSVSIVFITAIIASVIVGVIVIVIVVIISIVFVIVSIVVIVSVIIAIVVAFIGIATEEGQNIRNDNANHR
jgi:hypothetical protein